MTRIRRLAASSGSIALHGAILTILITGSWLRVEALGEPDVKPPKMVIIGPPRAAAAAAGSAAAPSRRSGGARMETSSPRPQREAPRPVVQPHQVPEETPAPAPPDGGVGGTAEGEQAGGYGVPGGDPNGTPDGVIGGQGGEGAGLPIDGGDQEAPLYLIGDVRPPERVVFVKPEYPEMARKSRAEGKVILEIVVGRTGEVETVKVLKSQPLFDQAAIEAVTRWKYQPALQSGRPVRVYLTVIVDFGLK